MTPLHFARAFFMQARIILNKKNGGDHERTRKELQSGRDRAKTV